MIEGLHLCAQSQLLTGLPISTSMKSPRVVLAAFLEKKVECKALLLGPGCVRKKDLGSHQILLSVWSSI